MFPYLNLSQFVESNIWGMGKDGNQVFRFSPFFLSLYFPSLSFLSLHKRSSNRQQTVVQYVFSVTCTVSRGALLRATCACTKYTLLVTTPTLRNLFDPK